MNDGEAIETLGDKYRGLDRRFPARGVEAIDTGCLLTFPYPDDGAPQEVVIDTDEFTAVCPWTGLPDYGKLVVCYMPDRRCRHRGHIGDPGCPGSGLGDGRAAPGIE